MGFYRFADKLKGEALIRRVEKYMVHLGLPKDKIELNLVRLQVNLDAFLAYSSSRGNDLSTPSPQFGFPGLKDGDRWCLCGNGYEYASKPWLEPSLADVCSVGSWLMTDLNFA